jgi:hypothetical protein
VPLKREVVGIPGSILYCANTGISRPSAALDTGLFGVWQFLSSAGGTVLMVPCTLPGPASTSYCVAQPSSMFLPWRNPWNNFQVSGNRCIKIIISTAHGTLAWSVSCRFNNTIIIVNALLSKKKGKAVPLHAMGTLRGRGGIAPTHSRPRH